MGAEVDRSGTGPGGRPFKALGVALLVDLLSLPLILLLAPVWPIVFLTVVPYIGGRLGGRYADRRSATRIGALAALVMMTLLLVILLSVLAGIQPESFDLLEPVGLTIVGVGYVLVLMFGALGGRHGAAAAGT